MSIIKTYIKFLKAIRALLLTVVILILLDMFVLGAWLKNFFVRANTSDYSPFSTDGQSNWIIVVVCVIAIIICSYVLLKACGYFDTLCKEEEEGEKKDETTENTFTEFNQ